MPRPDTNYTCRPERDHLTLGIIFRRVVIIIIMIVIIMIIMVIMFRRVVTIISGGGLSFNGRHVYCGDYIFSGHTFTMVMATLVTRQCQCGYSQCIHVDNVLVLRKRAL